MIWQNYRLDDTILKTSSATELMKTERGMVEVGRDGLAAAVKLDGKVRGYVFRGHCKLVLDTIVETREGAIGKPVEKEVNRPFLMLGATDKLQLNLSATNTDDFRRMGYENPQQFLTEAEELLHHFSRRKMGCHSFPGDSEGLIFAFPNDVDKTDVLLSSGSKLVYKATGIVFIADGNRTILKSPEHVVLSNLEKCIAMKN